MSGLTIPRYFTSEKQHPFDAIAWEVRDAVIVGKDGTPVFEARGVEFPAFWSQRATDIVASKYFRMVQNIQETSVRQMLLRVVDTIAEWGRNDGYFTDPEIFRQELVFILLHQYASFNSPVWFNVGVQEHPQTSACFILDVEDTMESILEWYRQEGMIFKGGSGSGVNLSKIRAKGSSLSGGGVSSGVMSFARVADANAGAVKSGGTTRRAAKLLVLDVDHPDIQEFIRCKVDAERLARHLMAFGYGGDIEGGAYDQVPWQNANNSVSVSDSFMSCYSNLNLDLNREYGYDVFTDIVKAAHECGCPGLFFHDTVNAWHTTPSRGPICSANPCGEFLRPPNEACNLASLNLLKFLKDDGFFDIPAFTHVVDIMITAMDILIDRSSYPTEAIAQNSKDYRPLGLGYANLGALLMAKGLPYDSEEGRGLAASITELMTGEAYSQSGRLAQIHGAFAGFSQNQSVMQHVMAKHINAAIGKHLLLSEQAIQAWDTAYAFSGLNSGYRNCQVTVLAPCGTISFMMDCDTTGIEPCLGLVTTKKLVGGGEIRLVNGVVDRALRLLGFQDAQEREALREAMMYGLPERLREHKEVFATALGDNTILWQGHIRMVAAVQPFLSGGVSKTINMPHDATIQDVYDAYVMAWKMGLKAISIYRDGSKGVQPVTVVNTAEQQRVQLLVCPQCRKDDALVQHEGLVNVVVCRFCGFMPVYASRKYYNSVVTARATASSDASLDSTALREEYRKGWEQGNYRPDGPLQRNRLPDERRSITHKFTINTHEGYLTVGLYDDGNPGELFVRMAKEGSTLGGLIDAWATTVSIALQYGVPLDVLVAKFQDGQYEPRGFTGNPDIRTTTSITDYIMRWMALKFASVVVTPSTLAHIFDAAEEDMHGSDLVADSIAEGLLAHLPHDIRALSNGQATPLCSECGNVTVRNGSCFVCTVCGVTTGCS